MPSAFSVSTSPSATERRADGEEPIQPSLRRRAMQASLWVLGTKPLSMAEGFLRSIILTRLLCPEAFGVMALVQVVNKGVQMFSDIGIEPSIVQNRRGGDPEFLLTAWTLSIIRGVCLWAAVCILAWPAAAFFNEPMLQTMLPVVGLGFILSGLRTTAKAICAREMRYARMMVLDQVVCAFSLVIVIVLALVMRNVWALVIGNLIGTAFSLVAGHMMLPGISHRLRLEPEAMRSILKFGKWVFISTLLTFFAMQGDKLLLGKLISLTVLGVYSIAGVLVFQVQGLVGPLINSVLFPAIAEQVRIRSRTWRGDVLHARGIVLQVSLLATLGVVVIGPAFFRYLYDSRYWDAGQIAQWLGVSVWASILMGTSSKVLLALGDSRSVAVGNGVNLFVTIIAAMLGYYEFGLVGFICGYALGTVCGEIAQGLRLASRGVNVLRQDMQWTLIGIITLGAAVITQELVGKWAIVPLWAETGMGLLMPAIVALSLLPGLKRTLFPGFCWASLVWKTRPRVASIGPEVGT